MHRLQNSLSVFNEKLRFASPQEIVLWACEIAKRPMVTTSFGTFSAALLHATTTVCKELPVVWCDTGYNTRETYQHADNLKSLLGFQLDIYTPAHTTAYIENTIGKPTNPNDPNHKAFAETVKHEPFKRALDTYRPDVWFTNLRRGTTQYRNGLDILSFSKEGILKVCPFYYFSNLELSAYIRQHDLPLEPNYYDPVKGSASRECGIHFLK